MTSTLTAATLTMTVTESISLNGYDQGSKNVLTITGITEISKRIVTVTTTEAEILAFGIAVAAGAFIAADVRYMRFSNKDDTNFISLTFKNEDNDEVKIKLDAGQSFIWNADNSGGLVDVMNATHAAGVSSGLGDLVNVQADADTASCDLEMFIASV